MNEEIHDEGAWTPLVRAKGVFKRFSSKAETLEVLRGVGFEIPRKRTCSIIGASGSGKSTLLALMGGLERIDSGILEIGTYKLHELREKDLPQYRSRFVGFVFQFHYLLKDFTALENVALPAFMTGLSKKESWEKAQTLLEKVGLGDRMGHFPSELSGGERQRTAIARAIVNDPSLVLADEPTGNLDQVNARSIAELLLELPHITGATVVLATHDSNFASQADLRFSLADGRIATL
ncbi:MAG: lipoprotein-releasing system ATP-binding protein [Spirochaetes bacterium]|nr:MAG: lipoprotein-releasing system ATP-binding protein [Spirochaetota bacterium]